MAKVTAITEHFQHFLADLKEVDAQAIYRSASRQEAEQTCGILAARCNLESKNRTLNLFYTSCLTSPS